MLNFFMNILMTMFLSYYLLSALQWYSYKISRVLFHYKKISWHIFYFILPLLLYEFSFIFNLLSLRLATLFFYGIFLFLWQKKLDKKLLFTKRIQQSFLIIFLFSFAFSLFYLILGKNAASILLPLILGLFLINEIEEKKMQKFEEQAKEKLAAMKKLKIILITASFGKTSIKNYLFDLLKDDFSAYKSPKSVNTKIGLIRDINENLPENCDFYIAEAGARESGDILEITQLLEPQIAIIGEIGSQHLEYFKTLENIRKTKLEILASERLEKVFASSSTELQASNEIVLYDNLVKNVQASLEGNIFTLEIQGKEEEFSSQILGKFSAYNLAPCILLANYLGMSLEKIKSKVKNLKNVEHRLSLIKARGKIIIDDSFNGNFSGMSQSYELVKNYEGRKVLITPGMVESSQSENEELAKIINDIFDLVIITSDLNLAIFKKFIAKDKLIILSDKSQMQELLKEKTFSGDLILFSNDAPSYI